MYTNSGWSKGGQDQPKIRNKSFLGYRWHVLTLSFWDMNLADWEEDYQRKC